MRNKACGFRAIRGAMVAVLVTAAGLAGCSSANLLGSSADAPQALTTPLAPVAASQPAVATKQVALAPIVGAPEAVNGRVATQLTSALQSQHVAVAKAGDKADYTLRGYMVAAKEKTGVKVSYIWDLTDPSGKRANRIQGEELATGGDGRDPWSAVSEQLTESISQKTASSLQAALASLPSTAASSGPAVAGANPPLQTASLQSTTPVSPTTRSNAGTTVVPVTGAPGDGNTSLMQAMRDELSISGISSAQPGQTGYTVAGKVTVGTAKEGKQSVRIDWKVTDPNGVVLATVSQNNDIPTGSLDGTWGNIANDAAQGAAVKIKTLIEENQTGISASRGPVRREAKSKT